MFPGFPNEDNKVEEDLDDFRQKLANRSSIDFEEKRNELNRSKNIFIGAVSGVVLAGIVGYFVLSPHYADNSNIELPVIRRPQSAVKVQPSDRGGMEILNRDKSVYNIIEKTDNNESKTVENLLPPPEEPQLPVIAPQPAENPVAADNTLDNPVVDKIIAGAANNGDQETILKAQEIIKVSEAPKPIAAIESKIEEETKPISQAMAETPVEAPKVEAPAPAKDNINIPAKETIKTVDAAAEAPKGAWQVQLMSSPNKNALESSWKNLIKKYSMLNDQPHEIETADLGAKGIFYRLKAGNFAARGGADTLCNDIKAMGGTCIVKKK